MRLAQYLSLTLLKSAGIGVLALGTTYVAHADDSMDMQKMHEQHMKMMMSHASKIPTMPGQDAFGTIQEIVAILEADPKTDWSKVNLEDLRQHLIDMNETVLHSVVSSKEIPGGLSMEITGEGRTRDAIQHMVIPHSMMLDQMPQWSAHAEKIDHGVRLVVTAKNAKDSRTVEKIRGLGFIGLLVQGAHHPIHHLMMARGERAHDHQH